MLGCVGSRRGGGNWGIGSGRRRTVEEELQLGVRGGEWEVSADRKMTGEGGGGGDDGAAVRRRW